MAEDIELERSRERRQRALKLEQAAYEVERFERQFNAVEPENRLVARTLEKRWEAALAEHDRLAAENTREDSRISPALSADEREAVRRLAEDIPALWRAPTTTAAERKQIARLMLERVVLSVAGGSENTVIECTWAGGHKTRHDFVRPVRWTSQLARSAELKERIAELVAAGLRPPAIARQLSAENWLSANGAPFTEAKIRPLMARMGYPSRSLAVSREVKREPDEMTVTELAPTLDLPVGTLYSWIRKEWLPARRVNASFRDIFLIRKSDAEKLAAKRRRVARQPQKWTAPTPLNCRKNPGGLEM